MDEKPRILVVDDERLHLSVIVELLGDEYTVMVAKSGIKALEIARSSSPPALILLDVLMPELDGYQVCQRLKSDPLTRAIPVIFLTVKSDVSDEAYGFDLGAVDYIIKPFSPPIVRARVATHLALKMAHDELAEYNQNLELKVVERTNEVRQAEAGRNQLQLQLQQAQKMDSLGQLTGGVAHDFNNILSVILGFTDMAKRSIASHNDIKLTGYLEQVETVGAKAGKLIEQLLAFTRGVPTARELLNLGEVVDNGFGLIRPIIPSGISFKTDFDLNLPRIELDQVQIYQVIMNLCINARDAMDQTGEISISTGWFDGHEMACATCEEIIPQQQIELLVADQGKGIAPEH
ncbi:MAG: response regulator, partial [Immundisolibacteraceae bacterium]|nr:response regulator [Immundisolibacteraceae bacterium]